MSDITLYDAKKLVWGTYGKSGKEPLRLVTFDECTTNHLENIFINLRDVAKCDVDDKYMVGVQLVIKDRKTQIDLPNDLFEIGE